MMTAAAINKKRRTRFASIFTVAVHRSRNHVVIDAGDRALAEKPRPRSADIASATFRRRAVPVDPGTVVVVLANSLTLRQRSSDDDDGTGYAGVGEPRPSTPAIVLV